jgi:hypothetical protein
MHTLHFDPRQRLRRAVSRDTARWVTDPLAPPLELLVRAPGE